MSGYGPAARQPSGRSAADGTAHLRVDGVPVCLQRPWLTPHCDWPTFAEALAEMQSLHEQYPARVFEAVAGPCPLCASFRTATL